MPRDCCDITDRAFTEGEARQDVRAYRTRGPARQTQELLAAIRRLDLKDSSLIDVGGGIGAVHHELLQDVARTAVHVDASSAYLNAAREETERLGHGDRVTFIHADFTDVAHDLPPADIVTMDRVVCCYPDFRALLQAAANKADRALVMSYPRESWYVRVGFGIVGAFQRMRRDAFGPFLHPVDEMHGLLQGLGLTRLCVRRLFIWEIALYSRDGKLAAAG
ncbi:MAG TPA: class I SAM-dependent methyltransferase [Anaerolineales bacterium]